MTDIIFDCTMCGQSLSADASVGGSTIACPTCSANILIPLHTATSQSSANAGTSSPKDPASDSVKTAATDLASKIAERGQEVLRVGRNHASTIIRDFKSLNFKEEVLPIDASNIQLLRKDLVFWLVTLLGIVPLLIVTVSGSANQLAMFALFFAFVWGVIFKFFVLKDDTSWKWTISVFFFTGIVGIWLLLAIYQHILPRAYLSLAENDNAAISLIGYIFQVGIWEEILKALPIAILLLWKPKAFTPHQMLAIGVFSGLGFAAFENLYYGQKAILTSYQLTRAFGASGLKTGVEAAMVNTMLRQISCVFCHGVWSGIAAYFFATAMLRRKKIGALILLGLCLSALLHGVYDWFCGVQQTIAALIAGLSFALFYGYVSKARLFSTQSIPVAQTQPPPAVAVYDKNLSPS